MQDGQTSLVLSQHLGARARLTPSPPRCATHHLVDIQGMLRVLPDQPGQGLGQWLPRVGQGWLLQARRVTVPEQVLVWADLLETAPPLPPPGRACRSECPQGRGGPAGKPPATCILIVLSG